MKDMKVYTSKILFWGEKGVLLDLCINRTNFNISESIIPEVSVLIVDLWAPGRLE